MLKFPIKQLNLIKRTLLRTQKEVEENIKEIEKEDPVSDNSLAESSEPGTDSYVAETHGKTLVFKDKLNQTKENVTLALSKIARGTYGKCEKCGEGIGVKRLLAMPVARLCLKCSG
jgi:DnaK suppressor protein